MNKSIYKYFQNIEALMFWQPEKWRFPIFFLTMTIHKENLRNVKLLIQNSSPISAGILRKEVQLHKFMEKENGV